MEIDSEEKIRKYFKPLYSKSFGKGHCKAHIGNFQFDSGGHSQYMVLVIEQSNGGLVALRMSTFRKIMKWVAAKGWATARRLKLREIAIMEFRVWSRRWPTIEKISRLGQRT